MLRDELHTYLTGLLEAPKFRDYCPNGLQVEGRADVHRVVTGVTASLELLEAAVAHRADAILVHHGWFWRSDDARITGYRRRRIALLMQENVNLYAFHLPLDGHPELGNNAALARHMGWTIDGRFGEQDLGFTGAPSVPLTLAELAAQLETRLDRKPLIIGDPARRVSRLAWCSGGAQGYFEAAAATGAQVFVSGEVSEQTWHLARETDTAYIAAGHHATERYGVQAVGQHLSEKFGIEHLFLDIHNPI